jgi:hypothetical protein
MATLFVDKIDPQSGTALEIGSSGDTITTATGAKPSFLYPAFEAFANTGVNVSDNTNTKVQVNTEVFDSDSCYDNSTNYRFTPNKAGKYYVYAKGRGDASGTNNVLRVITIIYKNGAELINSPQYGNISNPHNYFTPFVAGVVDMNGSSDYVEFYINVLFDSGTGDYFGDSSLRTTTFGSFRIGT